MQSQSSNESKHNTHVNDILQHFVNTMKSSLPPAVDKAGDSTFMSTVRTRLGYFLRVAAGPGSASDVPTMLVGRDAAQFKMKSIRDVLAQDKASVRIADIALL